MRASINFYKEANFKETPIGKIPKDWEITKLENIVAAIENGVWGDDPIPGEECYPVVRSTEITHEGKLDLSTVAFRRIPKDKVDKYRLKDGDILLVGSSGSSHLIGRAALFKSLNDAKIYLFSNFVIRIRPRDINSQYLYYFFSSPQYYRFLKALQQTSTGLRNLPKKEFKNMKIPLPSLIEQQQIVEVLSCVDLAVQKVDEAIARAERLKKGLMQQLLTKGIGHKEFKETPIGKIPKTWKIAKLKDICVKITDGSHWSPKEVEKSDYRIATVANLKETYIDINSCKFISEEDYRRLINEGDVPQKGDILFSKDGTVGICFAFKQENYKIGLLSSIAIIRPNFELLDPDFGAYALKSQKVFPQITGRKIGTALKRIILQDLKTVWIPVPPLFEQQKIAKILSSIDNILRLKKGKKEKLVRMKRRLMDLLLTGKVRVSV